jgi:hypothetical protein
MSTAPRSDTPDGPLRLGTPPVSSNWSSNDCGSLVAGRARGFGQMMNSYSRPAPDEDEPKTALNQQH